ncbi:MAG: hypothetical protein MUD15_04320 [Desulfobacterota bacterium]|nr:hypothetical protein [Thermodesulfobacteriota bacterium]
MDRDVFKDVVHDKVAQGSSFHRDSVIPLRRSGFDKPGRSTKKISQRKCINIVNYFHFAGSPIFAHAFSRLTQEEFLLKILPEPFQKEEITCSLPGGTALDLQNFSIKDLIVDDGKYLLVISITLLEVTSTTFRARIEDACYRFSGRSARRMTCQHIDAVIVRDNATIHGILEDFNPKGLRIVLPDEPESRPLGMKAGDEVSIELHKDNTLIFSGKCQCLRFVDDGNTIILKPLNIGHPRFKERKNRNPRVNLVPRPKAIFDHPFNNKTITYEIDDITTSGLSIREGSTNSLLMPGMILPSLTILYAGGLKIECSAQIVYSTVKRFGQSIRHGLSILDMTMRDFSALFDIVSNAYDERANMSSEINMDDLWEFFFDSGFIYPGKYEHLSQIKDKFKDTYKKLYHEGQDIFTNFTYQKNGRILGHNCTIRAYQRAWMIHHLAARSSGARRIGLDVLRHSHYYFDGMYRIPSIGMDYMIMYFRPNNRFPDYFFGGFCRDYKNPRACSMDLFAYLNLAIPPADRSLGEAATVQECTPADIRRLREWYAARSGGLAIDAFGIDTELRDEEQPLKDMYGKIGLNRSCTPFVLRKDGRDQAFLIADQSDAGINLSELLNSIKIYVVDPDLPWADLVKAVLSLGDRYETESIPLLVYPAGYLKTRGISYEKSYNLWVLNTEYGDDYVEYIKQKLQFNLIKFTLKFLMLKLSRS